MDSSLIERHPVQIGCVVQPEAPAANKTKQAPPSLESIAREVCLDAKHDAVKYLLRSNTWHDGE